MGSCCEQHTVSSIQSTTSRISLANRWDHFLARWAVNRYGHRVTPGLFKLGRPSPASPVFVTSNYTLSFDALRAELSGMDCYILVLDTKGINVWCAAGKGTFGTDELVSKIKSTGLSDIVKHKTVIVPQLGATGIAAHEVRKQSGFKVEYGPVRARDIRKFLESLTVTPQMRLVRFSLKERIVLIPVEFVGTLLPMIIASFILYFIGGFIATGAVVTVSMTGAVMFPLLLPWIPTPNFSTKGFILGGIVTLPFALFILLSHSHPTLWKRIVEAAAYLLIFPPVTAFIALNFTGATPITSKSGVEREIFTYVPRMAWSIGGGIILSLCLILFRTI